jgi:hypothetical protein
MELTSVQKEILSALISIQRQEGRAVKGEEIANVINRNPGTIRNQMQSLKALQLVEGVPGPKGGYRATSAAYEALNLQSLENVVDVPVVKNGILVEGATANEIILTTVMRPDRCDGIVHVVGNSREFNIGDLIEIGPTPVNKLYIRGKVAGRDDVKSRLIFEITDMVCIPKVPIRRVARQAIRIDPHATLQEASQLMMHAGVQEALVENGENTGFLELMDIAIGIAGMGSTEVREIMTHEFLTIDGDEPVYKAIRDLNRLGLRQIVVTESGVPWGIVTATDLMRSLTYR